MGEAPGEIEKSSRSGAIPDLIRSDGNGAVRAYREFLEDPNRSPSTCRFYGRNIRQFFRWAEGRGLALRTITGADIDAYAGEMSTRCLPQSVCVYLTGVRGLFQHLTFRGTCAENPFSSSMPGVQRLGRRPADTPRVPLPDLKAAVRELDNWEADSQFFQAGLVVLAPASIGTMEPDAVSRFTGVPEPFVRKFAARLRASGVWLASGKVAVPWDGQETGDGVVGVMLQVFVALGYAECKPGRKAREFRPPRMPRRTRWRTKRRPMRDDAIPRIVQAAGDQAILVYQAFLDEARWSANTRRGYRFSIRQFIRWAEGRGLALKTVGKAGAAAYTAELAARRTPQSASVALTAVRGLFHDLASAGVISANPFEKPGRPLLGERR